MAKKKNKQADMRAVRLRRLWYVHTRVHFLNRSSLSARFRAHAEKGDGHTVKQF